VALTKVTSAVIKDATITDADIGSTLTTAISGSTTAVSSSIATRFDSRETDMTLATASIAAITASISQIDSEIDTNSANMTLATASIAAITASLGQPVNTDSNVTFNTISSGDITSTGTITAVEVHTTFISSSITVASGSNNFGDALDDHHSFTGSLSISGSGTVTGSLTVEGPSTFSTADINGGTIDGITSLTAGGDLDIGAHDLRAATITADSLTATRVPFAGTAGVLSDDADLTFATATLSATNLTTTGTIKNMALVSGSSVSTGSFGSVVAGGTGVNSFTGNVILDNPGSLTRMTLENDTESNLLFTLGGSNKGQLYIDSNGVSLRSESGEDLRLLTGGNNIRMFISASGNIGIGTDSPTGILTIASSTTPSLTFNDTGGGADSKIFRLSGGGDKFFFEGRNDADSDDGDAGTMMTFDLTNGKIGIGDTAPSAPLEVSAGSGKGQGSVGYIGTLIAASSASAQEYDGASSNTWGPKINISNETASSTRTGASLVFAHRDGSSGVAAIVSTNAATDRGDLRFITRGAGNAIAERMIINDDGKVGIGTASPSIGLLDVRHTGANTSVDTATVLNLKQEASSTTANIRFNTATSNSAGHIIFNTDGSFQIRTDGNNLTTFANDGNVGIGTNTPNTGSHSRSLMISAEGSGARSALELNGNTSNARALISFLNLGTEKGYIESRGDDINLYPDGHVGIKTAPSNVLHVEVGSLDGGGIRLSHSAGTQFMNIGCVDPGTTNDGQINVLSNNALQFATANVLRGKFNDNSNGDFFTNDGSVSSLSDKRSKKNIVDLEDGLSIINQLKPKTFEYNGKTTLGIDDGTIRYGFIADDVLEVASHYVEIGKEKIDGIEVDDFKSLSTIRMIPMMIKSIQELSSQVTELKKEIEELKN